MDEANQHHGTAAPSGIRRIPKACGACRSSKVRCDGLQPCSRCQNLRKECNYAERPPNPNEDRFERVERDVKRLSQHLMSLQDQLSALVNGNSPTQFDVAPPSKSAYGSNVPPATHVLPSPRPNPSIQSVASASPAATSTATFASPLSLPHDQPARKRKKTGLQIRRESPLDFVAKGLLTYEDARTCFETFFRGCDRFVPIFDPTYDTFEAVRFRSSFLFNAIVQIGCSIQGEFSSQLPHALNFELKKILNLVVLSQEGHSLETVQALLVTACYSPERSLLLSFATRLALDLELPEAFERLTRKLMSFESGSQEVSMSQDELAVLMRQSRTWFGLLVLENILHVDAGKLPAFAPKGGARRCRVLLQQPFSTALDLRLLSQVELNYLRARIHDTFETAASDNTDEEVLDEVRNAKIDLDLWYGDWRSAIETSSIAGTERPSLLTNLTVQYHWSEAMAYFRGLKCLGTDNVDAMGQSGRTILEMAKAALKKHLTVTVEQPNTYLSDLRYAMDFVWAKCAFCFLLLLKLSRLLPERMEENSRLLEDGNRLLQSLTSVGTSAGSNTSRLYLQVLSMSIDKYRRALRENENTQSNGSQGAIFFWESRTDANKELQSFVPEQFVFEWDFPGLTLFSSPTAWQEFFDDFLLGFNGHEA